MSGRRVAVVTGSNKGIGLSIVQGLCRQFDGDVYLTARDPARGKEALAKLQAEGLSPKFHQLDICSMESVQELSKFLGDEYGGLDVLVNNAGIAFKQDSSAPFTEQAEVTCKTNFSATLDVCNLLFPLLRPHARVVHLSSQVSMFAFKNCQTNIRDRILAVSTILDVERLISEFVQATVEGNHREKGFANTAYGMSKIGVSAMTSIQQSNMNKEKPDQDIIINSCCPGYVATDMSSFKGPLTVEQGADTPIYLAMLPNGISEPKGKFVHQRKVMAWNAA